ncbi:oxidoreductase [Roseivirga sp. BDSF3-8]|uniref:oxidoreductase n=1 Tax=Roseivirga sp. BDSF3-8 TaxID=3241598 RepID=UPI0035318AEB
MTNGKTALIAGSTGLIGGHLLLQLLDDPAYSQVISLTRRPTSEAHPKLKEVIVDFDNLEQAGDDLKADHVFCCLGTTRKKAGSKEAFHKVDYHYVVELARQCIRLGASRFLVVSALGANRTSSVFYNQVKGEMEYTITHLDDYKGVYIFRPSLLLGDRNEKRTGERIAQWFATTFSFLFKGGLKKYQAIEGHKVATAMRQVAKSDLQGVCIFESNEIEEEVGNLRTSGTDL